MRIAPSSGRRAWLLPGLLLTAGLAARLYGAWAMRHVTDYDCGIVGLMARHMAAGQRFPVFFYGQAYMGSLEPAVSALLFFLFGESGFALNVGPALVAAAAMLAAMRWARDAGGRTAEAAAGLLLIMGPEAYYRFQFAARGGYMTTVLFGTLVLWLGARAAADLRAGRPVAPGRFLLIGLAAGLGWWSSQMVAAALLVCAGLLITAARFRPLRAGALPGAAGFLVGSAPFWIWNAFNGWASFDMAGHLGALNPLVGMVYLVHRYRQLVGAVPGFTPRTIAIFAFYPIAGGLGVWALWRGLRRRTLPEGAAEALTAAAAHLAISLFFFVISFQATMRTARFLVPMLPSVVILASAGLPLLGRRRAATLLLAAAAVIAGAQMADLAVHRAVSARVTDGRAADAELAEWLTEERIDMVYAHLREVALNFRIGEEPPVADLRLERVRPFVQRAERAARIAVIGDHGAVRAFLARTGGRVRSAHAGGRDLRTGFEPPAGGLSEIPPEAWASVTDGAGRNLAPLIAARNVETQWLDPAPPERPGSITLLFEHPRRVREVRLWSPAPHAVPDVLGIELLPPGEKEWRTAHAPQPVSHFFWCGPRMFWSGRRAYVAWRFPDDPEAAGIRITRPPAGRRAHPWRMTEIQVFEPDPEPRPAFDPPALEPLMTALRRKDIHRLYAGRWLSTRMHAAGLDVAVELDPRGWPGGGGIEDGAVHLDAHTALAVEPEDVARTLRVLADRGIVPERETAGPWTLLTFTSGDAARAGPLELWWTGRHVLHGNPTRDAAAWVRTAREVWSAGGSATETVALLEAAAHRDAHLLADAGDMVEALADALPPDLRREAHRYRIDFPLDARYASGAVLKGVTIEPRPVRPGEPVTLRTFWRIPPGLEAHRWSVFCHILDNGHILAQDDIGWSEFTDRRSDSGAVMVERTIVLPESIPPGRYSIRIGLAHPTWWRRLRPETEYPVQRRAVLVEDAVRIGEEETSWLNRE